MIYQVLFYRKDGTRVAPYDKEVLFDADNEATVFLGVASEIRAWSPEEVPRDITRIEVIALRESPDRSDGIPDGFFARKCDVTGQVMNDGWCFGDGEHYAATEDAANKLAQDYGCADYKEAYEKDVAYHTSWEELDDAYYYLADGRLVDVVD